MEVFAGQKSEAWPATTFFAHLATDIAKVLVKCSLGTYLGLASHTHFFCRFLGI